MTGSTDMAVQPSAQGFDVPEVYKRQLRAAVAYALLPRAHQHARCGIRVPPIRHGECPAPSRSETINQQQSRNRHHLVYEQNTCGCEAKRFQLRSRGSPGWAAAG